MKGSSGMAISFGIRCHRTRSGEKRIRCSSDAPSSENLTKRNL